MVRRSSRVRYRRLDEGWENGSDEELRTVAERLGIESYDADAQVFLPRESLIQRISQEDERRWVAQGISDNEERRTPTNTASNSNEETEKVTSASDDNEDTGADDSTQGRGAAHQPQPHDVLPRGTISHADARRRVMAKVRALADAPSLVELISLVGTIWTICKAVRPDALLTASCVEPAEYLIAQGELELENGPEDTSLHAKEFRRRIMEDKDMTRRTAKPHMRTDPRYQVSNPPPRAQYSGSLGVVNGNESQWAGDRDHEEEYEHSDDEDEDSEDEEEGNGDGDAEEDDDDIMKELRQLRRNLEENPGIIEEEFDCVCEV